MNENEYWIKFWKTVGTIFILFSVTIAGCVAHQNEVKRDLISKGMDPIAVTCALDGMNEGGRSVICANSINKFDIK